MACEVRSSAVLQKRNKRNKNHIRPFVNNYVNPFFDKMHNQLELGQTKFKSEFKNKIMQRSAITDQKPADRAH
jgi:hypothetical protein